ncbi:hypothetical protein GE061_005107 [Apolygus lucorum]|uniref:Reverse transcriptase domain-containing protein n=1 Tax=Apolygus lucorum TaxID=248454 RepID=A0A8S9WWR0_APOLU|nr:hypothetical protein GE061_005107 [Apolygus lucorum]
MPGSRSSCMLITATSENAFHLACSIVRDLVSSWCRNNKLVLNAHKTQSIRFVSRRGGDSDVTLLRLRLDESLTWSCHIRALSKSLSSTVCLLRRLSLSVSGSVLKSVYYALFESQLQYGVLLWGNSGGAARVLKLQKAAVRILGRRAPRTPCRPLFARLGLRTLPALLAEALVVRVRLNEGNFAHQSEVHDHDTRHSGDLVTSRHRLAITQKRSPGYLGVPRCPSTTYPRMSGPFHSDVLKLL